MSYEKQPWYVLTMDLAQLRDHPRAQLATLLHAPRLLGTGLWSGLGLGLELGLELRLWLWLGLAM